VKGDYPSIIVIDVGVDVCYIVLGHKGIDMEFGE
jgi:hypothetical protein